MIPDRSVRDALPPGVWPEPLRAALTEYIVDRAGGADRPLAVFDFDNTCIRGDIGETAFRELVPGARAEGWETYEHLMATDLKRSYDWLAEQFAGWTATELRSATRRVFDAEVAAGHVAVRPEIGDLVWLMQRHEWDVWVVTGSPEVVVAAVAQQYGIGAHRVIGMRLRPDEAGRFTPALIPPTTFRAGKVEAIVAATGRTPDFAAGDSMGDFELLQSARRALLVDRGHPTLQAEARTRGWWVQPAW